MTTKISQLNQKTKCTLFIFLITVLISITSCREKKTEDPIEAYTFWGGEVPKEVQVIHGKYWQSSHWTKEYILYLELKASASWRKEFIKQNNLVENKESETIPVDAPNWFRPANNCRIYKQSGVSEGSVYYDDTLNGNMFIYEIQL